MPAHAFNPTDGDLVGHLNAKITKGKHQAAESDINEIDLCSYEPEDIPRLTRIPSTHTWHVISPLKRKNGPRRLIKRTTKRGQWKVTGEDTEVKDHYGNVVGSKKYLTFYEKDGNTSASAKHKRTGWVIHELHSSIEHPNKENYVLCKLMKKPVAPSASCNDGVPALATTPVANPIVSHQIQNDINNYLEDFGVAAVTDPTLRDQTHNETNLMEDFCYGWDDFSNGFQSTDLAQLFRDFDEMPNDVTANWNSGS